MARSGSADPPVLRLVEDDLHHVHDRDLRGGHSRSVIGMVDVSDASQTAEYCPRCGRGIEWVLRREVMMPRQGVVDQPFRWMPCGHYVDPADEPLLQPRETWTAEST
jgi:hypothetical protein